MSGSDAEVEPMEFTDGSEEQPPRSEDKSAENKEEVQVTFSVEWSEGFQQRKKKKNKVLELEKLLQSWANSTFHGDCKVSHVHEDGSAVVIFKPAPAQSELEKLNGQLLKGRDGQTVKILSVSFPMRGVNSPAPEEASINFLPSSVSQQHEKSAVSTAGEEEVSCSVPVNHFWYVNNIYKEEIKRIEKENGVKIMAEVNVTFQGDQKDGSPPKALSEFISLVQKSLGESNGSIIPLKKVHPKEWEDTVNIIQKKENKLLLTVSSEEITVCGPRQSQDVIRKSLTATTNGESTWLSQDTPPNFGMSIKDPLVNAGLTMEESYWEQMTTSFVERVAEIKTKFNVDFKESFRGQGKVKIKAYYNRSEGNASMESHAVRALLQLYQKIATSSMSFTWQNQSEGASGGRGLDGQSGYNTGAATGGGATAGDPAEDETCPICLDKCINKKQLKCKHEFCAECMERATQFNGPTCPLCKDIFGLIEGDQPDGEMKWTRHSSSLPGFPGCGSITICYNIQSGVQTKKHSNPGKHYYGLTRTAYLPDNKEGKEVLILLKKAFDQRLIFTVGTSRTTGKDNQVTWNDIHHKTSITGGAAGFGYPDDRYLGRVKEELKAKGIV